MRRGVAVDEHLVRRFERDSAAPAEVLRSVVDLVAQHLDRVLTQECDEGELVGAGRPIALRLRGQGAVRGAAGLAAQDAQRPVRISRPSTVLTGFAVAAAVAVGAVGAGACVVAGAGGAAAVAVGLVGG